MDQKLAIMFAAISQRVVDVMNERTGALLAMGNQEVAAMIIIGSESGLTAERLSTVLMMSHSGCLRLVERLMLAGYVDRHDGRNKREKAIHLTELGAKMRTDLLSARQSAAWEILSHLDPAERNAMRTYILRMLDRMEPEGLGKDGLCRLCDRLACERCPANMLGQTEWRH
ncbi:MAG: MarR family winged helix-turn-helix transcriptional regulator [Sphingomonadales bacterium]